jgi:anti-anti-sigma factor
MQLRRPRHLPSVSSNTDTTILTLPARRFGEPIVHALGEELAGLADRLSSGQLYLDLSRVESISALGLGKLVALHKKLQTRGGSLALLNPQPLVHEALEATRLVKLLDVCQGFHATGTR